MNSGKFSHFEGDDGKDKKREKLHFSAHSALRDTNSLGMT